MKKTTILSIILLISSAPLTLAQKKGGSGSIATKRTVVVAKSATVDESFTAARKAYEAGDTAAAAKSVRDAASLIARQAEAAAKPEYAEGLAATEKKLEELASGIESGKVKEVAALDTEFAAAHHALATHFQSEADRSLAAGDKATAGEAMQSVANNLESGANWAGEKLSDGGKATIGLLRKTGGALVSGVGTGVEIGGDALKGGLGLITKLGSVIKGDSTTEGNIADKAKAATGGVVEGTGKTVEKSGEAVKAGGGLIKKVGDKIKGEDKPEDKADDETPE